MALVTTGLMALMALALGLVLQPVISAPSGMSPVVGLTQLPSAPAESGEPVPASAVVRYDARDCTVPATSAAADDPVDESGQGDVEVQLESAGSSPAGALVALTHTDQELVTDVIGNLPADDHGRVRFSREWCQPRAHGASVCVDLGFPTVGAYAMQLAADSEQVRMFLPERGLLRVEVQEADGSSLRELALAEVHVLTVTPPADRLYHYELPNGRAEIAVEAAGLLLEVRIATQVGRRVAPVTIVGPAVPGQTTDLVLQLAKRPLFTARLFDPIGQPLRQTSVEVRLAGTSIRLDEGAATDEDGVLRIPAPARSAGQPWRLRFLASSREGRPLHGELRADLTSGGVEHIGDVWLQEAELLVAGVCVDEQGVPLSGVMLKLQCEGPEGYERRSLFGSRWHDMAVGVVATRADGTFEIHGPQQPGQRMRLQARSRPSLVTPFAAGATDVQFVVSSAQSRKPAAR